MALILDLNEDAPTQLGASRIWRTPSSWLRAEPRISDAEPAWIEQERRERAVMVYSAVARMV